MATGQPRFFDSAEVLIVAFGGTLARKVRLKKPRASQAGQSGAKALRKEATAASEGKRVKKIA